MPDMTKSKVNSLFTDGQLVLSSGLKAGHSSRFFGVISNKRRN